MGTVWASSAAGESWVLAEVVRKSPKTSFVRLSQFYKLVYRKNGKGVCGTRAGSHASIVVSWDFPSSAIRFGYLDGINRNGAADNRILVEREVPIARPSTEEPATSKASSGYPLPGSSKVIPKHVCGIFEP